MGKVADVTDGDFEKEVLQSTLPTLIDFWAEWCAPCRQIKPILDDLAVRYDGKVKIVKLNVDENPDRPSTHPRSRRCSRSRAGRSYSRCRRNRGVLQEMVQGC
jgi:thiol-disulfide isomerase/thioredoxin